MKITGRQWLILLSVQFTTVLFGLTATSVTVILPQLKGALSATQEQISWVLTFNLVATAIATPLTGWLAARLGWRTLMVLSAAGFTVAVHTGWQRAGRNARSQSIESAATIGAIAS